MIIALAFVTGVLVGLYFGGRAPGGRRNWPKSFNRKDQSVKILVKSEDKKSGWFIELPQHQVIKLRTMAAGVANGKALSGSTWSGHGKLFSRADFEVIVELPLSRGWAAWVNPEAHNRGLRVTPGGLAAFRFLAGIRAHPHHPTQARNLEPGSMYAARTHIQPQG